MVIQDLGFRVLGPAEVWKISIFNPVGISCTLVDLEMGASPVLSATIHERREHVVNMVIRLNMHAEVSTPRQYKQHMAFEVHLPATFAQVRL